MMETLEDVWREESSHVLSALLRRHGDLGDCEDAAQEALAAATVQWPRDGAPETLAAGSSELRPGDSSTGSAPSKPVPLERRRWRRRSRPTPSSPRPPTTHTATRTTACSSCCCAATHH